RRGRRLRPGGRRFGAGRRGGSGSRTSTATGDAFGAGAGRPPAASGCSRKLATLRTASDARIAPVHRALRSFIPNPPKGGPRRPRGRGAPPSDHSGSLNSTRLLRYAIRSFWLPSGSATKAFLDAAASP